MRYLVMEPVGNTLLPTVSGGKNNEVVIASNLSRFDNIDYDARSELISERLKLLLEKYLPKYDFQPVVYLDTAKDNQMIFWRFGPPTYDGFDAEFRNDWLVSHITFMDDRYPIAFTARSPRGVRSIVVRLAVAESALRRCILGVKFTKVTDGDVIVSHIISECNLEGDESHQK